VEILHNYVTRNPELINYIFGVFNVSILTVCRGKVSKVSKKSTLI